MLGTVIDGSRQPYDATGDLWMQWDFGARSGQLEISKFDGERSFGTGPNGLTQVPNPNQANAYQNQFGGSLSGGDGFYSGSATGSFARGPNGPAQGVIGNWNIQGGNNYRATGVFAGTQSPLTQ